MAVLGIHNPGEATSYELVKELHRGGEGRTWKARQIGPGGPPLTVAVKILTPDTYLGSAVDPAVVLRRWRGQMQVMRNFGHEGFASVQVAFAVSASPLKGFETPDWMLGRPAFVMEWVDGVALSEWSRRISDPTDRLEVLAPCASGLDAFHHQTKHVHRDLKPSNVVVAGGRGRIIDFGLVRSVAQLRSRSGAAGSPGYLAPELAEGAEYTPQTDLYAFAGILFHQLLLRHPPDGDEPAGHVWALLRAAGFHHAGEVLGEALHRDPAMRPAGLTATALLERTMRFEQRAPVSIPIGELETRSVQPPRAPPSEASTVVHRLRRPGPATTRVAPTEVVPTRAVVIRILSVIALSTTITTLIFLLLRTLAA